MDELEPRILVGVCSFGEQSNRRDAIRETWASRIPPGFEVIFFIGAIEGRPESDVWEIGEAPDDYNHLPAKVRGFFQQALLRSDFDWLFKCDDDTYVVLDRLATLTKEGAELVGDGSFLPTRGAASGGAGYLLSRRLVELLAGDDSLSATGAEDVILSGKAAASCTKKIATHRLCYHCQTFPLPDNDLITCHWMTPDKMRAAHVANHSAPWHTIHVTHTQWSDELVLYEEGYFFRKSTFRWGKWDVESDDENSLLLEWFDSPSERLILEGWNDSAEGSPEEMHSSENELAP